MASHSPQRVECPRCRHRFTLAVPDGDGDDWECSERCPACDSATRFTIAHVPDRAPRLETEGVDPPLHPRLQAMVEPLERHHDHPAMAWFDRIGNGLFEDDRSADGWPTPGVVYRFQRGDRAAYVWQVEGVWFVRGWHPVRKRGMQPPRPVETATFVGALHRLTGC